MPSMDRIKTVFSLDTKTSSFRKLNIENAGDRGHWGNKTQFMLSCIGLSVGLGNVWRFPTKAYKNGGAAFFIPYIILQLTVGKPMYFMELVMGQYAGLGPTVVFRCNPMAKGVGVSMVIAAITVALYYNAIMSYCLYYLFASMQETLPWTYCEEEWTADKTNYCYQPKAASPMPKCDNSTSDSVVCACTNLTDTMHNFNFTLYPEYKDFTYDEIISLATNASIDTSGLLNCIYKTNLPAWYFFEQVSQQGQGTISNIGAPIWYMTLILLLSWIIVVLCLLKGVKSSGKVVYFTATFPYVVLLALLIRGATLDGALEGIRYFIVPIWSKLGSIEVWTQAGGQMFFSLSICMGAIYTMGSYNKIHNNVYIDSLIISSADIITSIIAGLVVFSVLGAMSHDTGVPIQDLSGGGTAYVLCRSDSHDMGVPIQDLSGGGMSLAFVAYPEALKRLPIPHFWSIIFFFMLFTLGIDSEFGAMETGLTTIVDEFPQLLKYKWQITVLSGVIMYLCALPIVCPFALMETGLTTIVDEFPKLLKYKWQITVISGVIMYLCALPIVCPGGLTVLSLIDDYGVTYTLYLVCIGELVAIMWQYGYRRFLNDVDYMIGYHPHPVYYWIFCWTFLAPIIVTGIYLASIVNYETPDYLIGHTWAQVIAWMITIGVCLPMPAFAIKEIYVSPGTCFWEKVTYAMKPRKNWGPQA